MCTEPAAGKIGHHGNEECRVFNYHGFPRIGRCRLATAGLAGFHAALSAAAIDPSESVDTHESHLVGVTSDQAAGPLPDVGLRKVSCRARKRFLMKRVQAIAGDPFPAWVTTD